MYSNTTSGVMSLLSSASCCHYSPPIGNRPKIMTKNNCLPMSSDGHLTKVLTNFSIDSIIGEGESSRLHTVKRLNDKSDQAKSNRNDNNNNNNNNNTNNNNLGLRKIRPKNFACPVCQMAFSNNGQLKNHVRIHTGERPFQCNQTGCHKTFTRNEELTRHKLIHTGARPHACPSCCKSFGRKDHLKKHVRTHERKLTRKRVHVSAASSMTSSNTNRLGKINDPVYSPPSKRRLNTKPEMLQQWRRDISTCGGLPASSAAVTLPLPINDRPLLSITDLEQFRTTFMSPPVTLAQNFNQLIDSHPIARTMSSLAVTDSLSLYSPAASSAATMQQLPGDYWQNWYSFLGLCHHQHRQIINKSKDRI